jgi:hypothetical protein
MNKDKRYIFTGRQLTDIATGNFPNGGDFTPYEIPEGVADVRQMLDVLIDVEREIHLEGCLPEWLQDKVRSVVGMSQTTKGNKN